MSDIPASPPSSALQSPAVEAASELLAALRAEETVGGADIATRMLAQARVFHAWSRLMMEVSTALSLQASMQEHAATQMTAYMHRAGGD